MDDVSKQEGIIAPIDADEDVVLEDAKDVAADAKDGQDADIDESDDIQGRTTESQAQIYNIDLEHANKVLSMQDEEESEPTKLQEVVDVVTTANIITEVVTATSDTITAASTTITAVDVPIPAAPTLTVALSRRTKGVVIRDPEESATSSTIIHSKAKSKDKGKGNLKKQKEDKSIKRYQALKRNSQTAAQARKNMMIYLRNVAGFKMDYFKGMTYDDIRPIFEKHFDSNVAFLQKTKEQMDEEDSRALKRMNESKEDKAAKKQKLDEEDEELKRHLQIVPNDDDVYTEATPLARKVPVVDYEIYNENNKPYFKIKRVDERFATTKPKNFSDDFLLITLGAMFEKPDIQAQIWKNQRSVHGQAKVKSWKLLESCGVQIITFTTTQLILLVERRYPLTSFGVDAAMDFKGKYAKCLMLLVKDLVLPSQDDVVG
nr:hypothetical protein [Tanacetum cinerariifolium]